MRLCSHPTSGVPPSGLQWPWDVAAISPLVGASTAKKVVKRAREEIVRYPDMLRSRRRNWRGCASAGNGRTSHQASRCANRGGGNFGVDPTWELPHSTLSHPHRTHQQGPRDTGRAHVRRSRSRPGRRCRTTRRCGAYHENTAQLLHPDMQLEDQRT